MIYVVTIIGECCLQQGISGLANGEGLRWVFFQKRLDVLFAQAGFAQGGEEISEEVFMAAIFAASGAYQSP